MTPKPPGLPALANPNRGFVVAMRARLVGSRPPHYEWTIVSRWGPNGENLTIGWTGLPAAAGETPIELTPRQTAFAVRPASSTAWAPATFCLATSLPNRLTVAGDFVPAEGYVRLYGSGSMLRMCSRGVCPVPTLRGPWHLEATRTIWIGEFIEPDVAAGV
ncbi:MAG TPA: hypothetical protein VHU42_10795 [Rhodopila sp.]|jgi:hypothetical protein|nr:hypothetical protein [Rhodopila sp.]